MGAMTNPGNHERAKEITDAALEKAGEFAEKAGAKAAELAELARDRAPELVDKVAELAGRAIETATAAVDKATGGRFHEYLETPGSAAEKPTEPNGQLPVPPHPPADPLTQPPAEGS